MATIELPAVEINAHSLEQARRVALVVLSLLSFWVMAAATTSHHGMYHYEYYPALTFFVWVGVVSFLYNGGLAVARAVGGVSEDLLRPLEAYAPVVLLWLCYTAAVAASATFASARATNRRPCLDARRETAVAPRRASRSDATRSIDTSTRAGPRSFTRPSTRPTAPCAARGSRARAPRRARTSAATSSRPSSSCAGPRGRLAPKRAGAGGSKSRSNS